MTAHTLTEHAKVEATCTMAGTEAYWDCSVCKKLFIDKAATTEIEAPEVILAMDHDWDTPTYEWTADNSEVTATRVCKRNPAHKETEKKGTTRELITPQMETEAGAYQIVSKTFENPAFVSQTKGDLVIPALENMDVLIFPAFLKTIETKAFEGVSTEAIIIPDECTTIEPKAFMNCNYLLYIEYSVSRVPRIR